MKKVLSLVLAFAMILGSFGFVFASDFSDVSDNEYYSEPINVLSGLGVITGFDDGTFRPDKTVTRAEMAVMIINSLGLPVSGTAASKFEDAANHWASGWIALAENLGIIAGYPDGTFRPNNNVSYNEALTMIVAALGYKVSALTGTWPGSVINQARALKILDICKTTGTTAAPRQDIACFLYKALTSPIGKVNKDDEFVKTVTGTDENGKDIYDTMLARLGAQVRDADEDGKADELLVGVDTVGIESLINMADYLGQLVTVYVNDEDEIVAIKEVKSEFITGTYEDLTDDYKFDDDTLVVPLFENGDHSDDKSVDNYSAADTVLKVAAKLSGKKVTEYYSIQIWEADVEDVADGVQDEIIDYKEIMGQPFALDDDDEILKEAFSIVGRNNITDIKDGDVVTIYLHTADNSEIGYAAGDIAKIEVSDVTVSGAITKINADHDAYTIGGTAYALSDLAKYDGTTLDYAKMNTLMGDETEATFKLNYAGDIHTYDTEDTSSSNYAVVLASGREVDSRGKASAYVELFLADGTSKEFEVDDTKWTDAVADSSDEYAWETPLDAGTVVKYTIDDDVIVDFEYDFGVFTDTVSKSGVMDWGKFSNDTVIFNMTDTAKPEKAASYEVIKASDLYDKEVTFAGILANTNNVFTAAVVKNLNAVSGVYAIFVKTTGSNANGQLWTALYDGEVKEFTVKGTTAQNDAKDAKYTTGASVKLATITTDGNGYVTAVDATATPFDTIDNTNGAITISGTVLTDGNKDSYELADDVKIYVYDGSKWEAKAASALAGRVNTFTKGIVCHYNDDGEVDIVIAIKK